MKTKVKKCKVCGTDPAYYSDQAGYDLCTKHQTRLIKKKISIKKAALLLVVACVVLYFISI